MTTSTELTELHHIGEHLHLAAAKLEELLDVMGPGRPEDVVYLTYPRAGGRRAMSPGLTRVNFLSGVVDRPDGLERLSTSLGAYRLDSVRSGVVWHDCFFDGEAKYKGKTTGLFHTEMLAFTAFQGMPMDELSFEAPFPYNLYFLFSTANYPPISPTLIQAVAGSQDRFGEITTPNSFEGVLMAPTEGGELATAYRRAPIHTHHIGVKVFFVKNTGANDADVNIQLRQVTGKDWVDAPSTGASTTVAAGTTSSFEETRYGRTTRIRARSTTAGSPTTLEIQYGGISLLR